jgi:hypothetical protein
VLKTTKLISQTFPPQIFRDKLFLLGGLHTIGPGATTGRFRVWSGGGGGQNTGMFNGSAGGGGGAFAERTSAPVAAGETYLVTVGLGGIQANPGQAGTQSSIAGTPAWNALYSPSANGGGGGNGTVGGAGGVALTGNILYNGGPGGNGAVGGMGPPPTPGGGGGGGGSGGIVLPGPGTGGGNGTLAVGGAAGLGDGNGGTGGAPGTPNGVPGGIAGLPGGGGGGGGAFGNISSAGRNGQGHLREILMNAGPWLFTNNTRRNILDGTTVIGLDSFKVALFLAGSNISATSNAYSGLTNEVAAANGYATGGKAVTIALSGTQLEKVTWTADPTWTASGTGIIARYAILYEIGGNVFAWCVLDATPADISCPAGSDLILHAAAAGLFLLGSCSDCP